LVSGQPAPWREIVLRREEAVRFLLDSLDTLVQAGLMPARHLADENNHPLRSRRKGDFLIVENAGPDPWTWRWQGLDARR
jgi:hypothetical protein